MKQQSQRYHGFDALRSIMLLLGVFLHISLSYFPNSPGLRDHEHWYYYDEAESWLAPLFYGPVHIYRLPIFFVLAGFFAALLVSKRSFSGMLVNRLQRLALPLLIAIPLCIPAMYSAARFAYSQRGVTLLPLGGRDSVWHLIENDLHYLWFLWHLLLQCVLTAVGGWLIQNAAQQTKASIRKLGSFLACSPLGIALLLFATTWLNTSMRPWPGFVETNTTYVPATRVFLSYSVYFVYGIALFSNREILDRIASRSISCLVTGSVLLAAYATLLTTNLQTEASSWTVIAMSVLSALASWSMIWGCMGIALKYCNTPNTVMRYISDSSYWVYLSHMPLVFLAQAWLAPYELTGTAKLLLSATFTMAICLVSYQFLVRDTPIGTLLNGRRYGRRLKTQPARTMRPVQNVLE